MHIYAEPHGMRHNTVCGVLAMPNDSGTPSIPQRLAYHEWLASASVCSDWLTLHEKEQDRCEDRLIKGFVE